MRRRLALVLALAALLVVLAGVAIVRLQGGDESQQARDAKDAFALFSFPDAEQVRTHESPAGPVSFYLSTDDTELTVIPPPDAVEEEGHTYLRFFRVPNPSGSGPACNVDVDEAPADLRQDGITHVVGVFC